MHIPDTNPIVRKKPRNILSFSYQRLVHACDKVYIKGEHDRKMTNAHLSRL